MKSKFVLVLFFLMAISSSVYAAKTAFDEYIIGPGDVLEIIVWKEPDFTRDATVRPDGRITLPLIDDVMAAGKTPMQLKEEIQKKLQEYIDLPVVTVIVKEINSKFYYMIGEIKSPGAYSLSKPMTILQALAVAGGFTEWANKDKIMVLRFKEGKRIVLHFSYEQAVKGKDINDFNLMPDDIVLVP
ncbi:polysaccharide biosynthesis/export family protein [Thermodesulfatator atlanticus]|uniref:polysaccharide biosynthesis/export family protein n=1 Tax=Thermodesulfatator atlanticus TaxID=501497 RepID=UPI0003B71969|nr:polysaccharide biosynthesis/export family protein [Thermodesulfatator atlanticus]